MRAVGYSSFIVWLTLMGAGQSWADDQADLKALVDKAIKAAGGEAKLKAFKAFSWKGKGTVEAGEEKVAITIDASMQGRNQGRLDMTAEIDGRTVNVGLVIDKDKGWFKSPKGVEAIPKEIFAALSADFHALRLAQMLVALKDKDCKLSALGEDKIDDKPAVGIKAAFKGFPDVDIFFEKKTMLPLMCRTQVTDNRENKDLSHQFIFNAPKKTGDVQHFTKILFKRDGKKMIEVELSDLKPADKLDDRVFAKPE
jgi:hypothetical protein